MQSLEFHHLSQVAVDLVVKAGVLAQQGGFLGLQAVVVGQIFVDLCAQFTE